MINSSGLTQIIQENHFGGTDECRNCKHFQNRWHKNLCKFTKNSKVQKPETPKAWMSETLNVRKHQTLNVRNSKSSTLVLNTIDKIQMAEEISWTHLIRKGSSWTDWNSKPICWGSTWSPSERDNLRDGFLEGDDLERWGRARGPTTRASASPATPCKAGIEI